MVDEFTLCYVRIDPRANTRVESATITPGLRLKGACCLRDFFSHKITGSLILD